MATLPFDKQANEYSFASINMELSELNFSLEPTATTLPSTITDAISDYQTVVTYDISTKIMRDLFKISSDYTYTNEIQGNSIFYNDASHVKLLLGNTDASASNGLYALDVLSKFFGYPELLKVSSSDLSNSQFNSKSQPISSEYVGYLAQLILNDSNKASVFRNTNAVTMDIDSKIHKHMNARGDTSNAPSLNLFNSVYAGLTAHELLSFKDTVLYALDLSCSNVGNNTEGAKVAIDRAIATTNSLKGSISQVVSSNCVFDKKYSLNTTNNSITDINSTLYYNYQDLSASMIFISNKLNDISGAVLKDATNNSDASYNTALQVRQAVADLFYTEAFCLTYAHQIYTDRANTLNTIYKTMVNKVATYQDVFLAKQAALATLVDVSNNYTAYSSKFTNSYLDTNSPFSRDTGGSIIDVSNVIMKTLYQDISGLNLTVSSGGYNSQIVGTLSSDASRNGLVNIIASMTNDLFSSHLQSLYNAVGPANITTDQYSVNLRPKLQQYFNSHNLDVSCVTGFFELANVPGAVNVESLQALQANAGGPSSYISDQFTVPFPPVGSIGTSAIVCNLTTSVISSGQYNTPYSNVGVEKVHYGSSYVSNTNPNTPKYFRNIPWFIYKNMHAQAPQRFTGLLSNIDPTNDGDAYYKWQTFSMPFQVGDSIEYAIQITPNPQQMHVGHSPMSRKCLFKLNLV